MSAIPAPTASKVSNGRTSAPAGNTSILMRPPLAAPIVCAKRTALDCSPGNAWSPSLAGGCLGQWRAWARPRRRPAIQRSPECPAGYCAVSSFCFPEWRLLASRPSGSRVGNRSINPRTVSASMGCRLAGPHPLREKSASDATDSFFPAPCAVLALPASGETPIVRVSRG
jgi:hypothetical protein